MLLMGVLKKSTAESVKLADGYCLPGVSGPYKTTLWRFQPMTLGKG